MDKRLSPFADDKLSSLARVLDEAPFLSRCSDNKSAAIIRPRELALRHPYMQINRPGMVSWLIFDLDHSNPLIWEDENLPSPNIIVSNRNNGKSHLYYAIPPVCTTENARAKPIAYMKAVYEAMALRLDADLSYSGPVAKTPGHSWWRTSEVHNNIYDLGELADYVDLVVKPFRGQESDLADIEHSRHCLLFEKLRRYAYSIVENERSEGNFIRFCSLLEAYGSNLNNFREQGFDQNLSISQVKATVKSVSRWTWDRYTGTKIRNKGVMGLDSSLALNEKQSLSAKRTHVLRKNSTERKILSALNRIIREKTKTSYTAISKLSGLSRQTVAKYKDLITERLNKPNSEESSRGRDFNVNYGVHQITAEPIVRKSRSLEGVRLVKFNDSS